MRIRTHAEVNVQYSITYKKRKYHYNYQFVTHGGELRFRGLSVGHYGVVHDFQKTTGRDWNEVVFLYPGMQKNVAHDKSYGQPVLKVSDLPPDIRDITKRKDLVIPEAVKEAAQRKVKLTVSDEFAKR